MYQLVDTQEGLRETAHSLQGARRLFLDTEFESSRGGTLLCLLQVSTGTTVFLVDTLRLGDLGPLREPLMATDEWVLHAAQQDLPLLQAALGAASHPPVFDTQVAWAMSSPEYSVSLTYLVFRVLGVRCGKAHQTDDWKRRPLPESQLRYAAADVESLPGIHARISEKLLELGRLDLVHEVVDELLRPSHERVDRLELGAFRHAWQLDPKQQAALQHLITWFNGLSPREKRHAPDPKVLLSIASRLPRTTDDLRRIKGVPPRWCSEAGRTLLTGLSAAAVRADTHDFVPIDPAPYATFEAIRYDAWLQTMRAEVCAKLAIAPELAFPARLLRQLHHVLCTSSLTPEAAIDLLHGWRRVLIGPTLERYLIDTPPPFGTRQP